MRYEIRGNTPIETGKRAAIKLIRHWNLSPSGKDPNTWLREPVMLALFQADRSQSDNIIEEVLLTALEESDSSEVVLWERLADHYFTWDWPNYRDNAVACAQQAVQRDENTSRAYYIHGRILWRDGGYHDEAVASWKLAHLYEQRDPDPLIAISWLDRHEIKDLRLGNKTQLLTYAVRIRPADPLPRIALAKYLKSDQMRRKKAEILIDEGLGSQSAQYSPAEDEIGIGPQPV